MSDIYDKGGVDEVIELTGDAGDVLHFYHIGTIDYKGDKYVFFEPSEEEDENYDEVVVFKMGKDKGEDVLLPIDDDDLMTEVFDEFTKLLEKQENGECPNSCEACDKKGDCRKTKS